MEWNVTAVMYKEDALLTPKHNSAIFRGTHNTLKKQTTNQLMETLK